ncbi:hypothetical protein ACFY05_23430 [Microtetraspora fusca]|uniref:Uncharacterized protein n=1 Tax=Microtetraspora fusca TaxID=1997 RepID=A0ABW6VCI8_MICFU
MFREWWHTAASGRVPLPVTSTMIRLAGIGFALKPTALGAGFARSSKIVAGPFFIAGIDAILGTPRLIYAIVMSVV